MSVARANWLLGATDSAVAAPGRAIAIDSTVLSARGGVWHKKDREVGIVPHTSIDTEAAWTKSGWKLHIVAAVASVWIPLAADLTPANVVGNNKALSLLPELLTEARFALGNRHYNTPNVRLACEQSRRLLVATLYGTYPPTDAGVEVSRFGASSTSCVRWLLKTSTSISKPSSLYTGKCPPAVWRTPGALLCFGGRSLSINWRCCTDSNMA
jgi:hypothetical protein